MKQPEQSKALAIKLNSKALSTINTMEDLDRIIDYVANSNTYSDQFKRNIDVTNEAGETVKQRVVDRNAIATCLMLGNELGFKPIESLLLGTKLDASAVVKVHRGKDLGLSPTSAMQNIYVFSSGDGRENVFTGIHVISKCLIDNKVKREIIEDGTKLYYTYFDFNGDPIDNYDERTHYVVNNKTTPADLKKAVEEDGKKLCRRVGTKRALVKLTRHYQGYTEEIAIPYTAQQAIDAGLLAGKKSDGSDSKGKNNWNNHPETHLVKMSTTLGARIIIGDALQGVYISEELPDNITEEADAEDVTEVN